MFEYTTNVLLMWIIGFFCIQIGGVIGYKMFKFTSLFGFMICQTITFGIILLLFPSPFGIAGG